MHIFLRVAYLQCTNEACGWLVRAQFEMTHEMSPSGTANPSVRLPVADIALQKMGTDLFTRSYPVDFLHAIAQMS